KSRGGSRTAPTPFPRGGHFSASVIMALRNKGLAMSTFLLSWLFLLAAPAQQTATQNPADLCTIQGVVIKAGTGEPLHKATVEALPAANRRGPADESQGGSAETDAMGRFEMKGLAPGQYRLTASRNGYVRQLYGQRTPGGSGAMLTLSSGEKSPNITFQMIPAAVISGHVYDEDGEPVVYAQVSAMQYRYANGQRQLMNSGSGQTNDLGEFRIFGLSPGQYYVRAMHRISRPETAKTGEGYVPIYYPGVADSSRAAPLALRGGDESSGVDISLQPVRTLAVRGNVLTTGCGGASPGGMVFLSEQNSGTNAISPSTVRDANGQKTFEFPSVPPGSYFLSAMVFNEGRQCVGRQAIEVGDADLDGVAVTATRGVEIKGRVRVEGQLDSNLGSFPVILSPKHTGLPFGAASSDSSKPDGSFLLKNAYDGD